MRRLEAQLLLVVAALALPLGWAIEWSFADQARDAEAAPGWPSAPGVITESRVRQGRSVEDPTPLVRYDYRVDGETYAGSGVSLSIARFDGEPAHEVVARYPAGREVRVFHDPADPRSSTLEQATLDFWDHLLLWIGTAGRWGGAACLVLALVLDRAAARAMG